MPTVTIYLDAESIFPSLKREQIKIQIAYSTFVSAALPSFYRVFRVLDVNLSYKPEFSERSVSTPPILLALKRSRRGSLQREECFKSDVFSSCQNQGQTCCHRGLIYTLSLAAHHYDSAAPLTTNTRAFICKLLRRRLWTTCQKRRKRKKERKFCLQIVCDFESSQRCGLSCFSLIWYVVERTYCHYSRLPSEDTAAENMR